MVWLMKRLSCGMHEHSGAETLQGRRAMWALLCHPPRRTCRAQTFHAPVLVKRTTKGLPCLVMRHRGESFSATVSLAYNARHMSPTAAARWSSIAALEKLSADVAQAITHAIRVVAVRCVPSHPVICACPFPFALPLLRPYAGRCNKEKDVTPANLMVVGARLRLAAFGLHIRLRIREICGRHASLLRCKLMCVLSSWVVGTASVISSRWKLAEVEIARSRIIFLSPQYMLSSLRSMTRYRMS